MLFPAPRNSLITEMVVSMILKFRRARSQSTLQAMHRKIIVGPAALATSDWTCGDAYSYEVDDDCHKSYQELAESFYEGFDLENWAASLAAAHRVFELEVGKKLDFKIERLVLGRDETAVMEWASELYDLVIVDTPPVLAVTDPSIVGALAGTTLMVARFGMNTVKNHEHSRK